MNCPVCLSAATTPAVLSGVDFLFESSDREFLLSRCGHCRCFFLDPQPEDPEIGTFYPPQYWHNSGVGMLGRLEEWYRRVVLRDHIRVVVQSLRARAKSHGSQDLLDVGCGTGVFLALMKQRGLNVRGFDSSREAARIARVENGLHVEIGASLDEAQYPAASFDCVTMFHVLEHVRAPRTLLKEVRRILRPDGRIIVQVPNIDSWQCRVLGARWYGLDIPRHLIDYSQQSIVRLLSDCGFQIHGVRHFNLRDNAPALASSLAPWLDPVSRNARRSRPAGVESSAQSWLRHAMYLGLVALSYPVVLAESAAGAGATIMIDAGP